MDDSSSRVRTLVREAFADRTDAVRVIDLDADKFTTISLSERFGAVTIRFGESYMIHIDGEDAAALGEALLAMATNSKTKQ